jgi:hypothetical protein
MPCFKCCVSGRDSEGRDKRLLTRDEICNWGCVYRVEECGSRTGKIISGKLHIPIKLQQSAFLLYFWHEGIFYKKYLNWTNSCKVMSWASPTGRYWTDFFYRPAVLIAIMQKLITVKHSYCTGLSKSLSVFEQSPHNWWFEDGHHRILLHSECGPCYTEHGLREQFGVPINVWRPAGDTLNITCNFLYCNHQMYRGFWSLCILHNLFWQYIPTKYGPKYQIIAHTWIKNTQFPIL